MRIVTTNDFVGSFFPQETSYGSLPGAVALQAAVDELRTEAGGGLWIDTGDLAQASALGALSDGVWPFLALGELSIDATVVGNHELDWGVEHFKRWSAELPFDVLAANLPLDLPATSTFGDLGVVGMSLPAMEAMHPGIAAEPDPIAVVVARAAELRGDGARHVALALHDGVDGRSTERMESLCEALRGHVDVVLGGHTLSCHAGRLAGVPFVQPWGFGSQVGVADLNPDGSVELRLVDVGPARAWTGAGAAAQAVLEGEVVGRIERPLTREGRSSSLATAIADGVLRTDDRLDAVFVGAADLWNQPARDGVDAFLDAGDVTLAQVLRLTPFTGARSVWGGRLVAADVPDLSPWRERGAVSGRAGTLAVSTVYAAAAPEHDWHPIAATLRDGLLAAVAR